MTIIDTTPLPDRRKVVALLTGSPWWTLPGMAVLAEAVFLIALVMAFLGEDKTLLNVMCTAAIAQLGLVTNYFFGSSAGSVKKDDAAAADSAKKTEALATSAPAAALTVTKTTINPGPPVTATTTTSPVEPTPVPTAKE